MTRGLTTAAYWQEEWARARHDTPQEFGFFEEVARHLPPGEGRSFLEVGYAPGGILGQFCARLGYEAHGIDFAAEPSAVRPYLEGKGVRVGALHKGDFLGWEPPQRYDVVASFGLVEHFEDPDALVDRHFALARPGGHVVIALPNFARGQWLLHRLFDPAMLPGHNFRCMNERFLLRAAERNRAAILTAGYVGGRFAFWDSGNSRRSWLAERLVWRTTRALKLLTRALPGPTNPLFSPYLIGVYRTPDV